MSIRAALTCIVDALFPKPQPVVDAERLSRERARHAVLVGQRAPQLLSDYQANRARVALALLDIATAAVESVGSGQMDIAIEAFVGRDPSEAGRLIQYRIDRYLAEQAHAVADSEAWTATEAAHAPG